MLVYSLIYFRREIESRLYASFISIFVHFNVYYHVERYNMGLSARRKLGVDLYGGFCYPKHIDGCKYATPLTPPWGQLATPKAHNSECFFIQKILCRRVEVFAISKDHYSKIDVYFEGPLFRFSE